MQRPQRVPQLVPLSPCYQFPDRIAGLDHAAHGRSALGWMVCGDDWVRATLGYDVTSAKTRPMELRHLRYFVAVAEEGSLTVAAERRLHTAQPSLSRQMQDLE